jgi:hypothetical protein
VHYGGPEHMHAQVVDRKEYLGQFSVPTLIVERGEVLYTRSLYLYAVDG